MIDLSNKKTIPTDVQNLILSNPKNYGPLDTIDKEIFDLIRSELINENFLVMHATCVKCRETIYINGVKKNTEQNYLDNLKFLFDELNEAEAQEVKELFLTELRRKNELVLPKVYVFCCEEDLDDEQCPYYSYCDNIGGEIAGGALLNKKHILDKLKDGERIIVKAKVPLSFFDSEEEIIKRIIKMVLLNDSDEFSKSFDTALIHDILPENIISITDAVLWKDY